MLFLEGFTDCMLLHQSGVHHALGALSEPPTLDVLKRLKQLGVREAQVLLSHERTSLEQLLRWARMLLEAELPSTVLELAPGQSLEALLAGERRGGLDALLVSARPLSLHLFDTVLPRGALSAPEEKLRALAALAPLVSPLSEGLTRLALVITVPLWDGDETRNVIVPGVTFP